MRTNQRWVDGFSFVQILVIFYLCLSLGHKYFFNHDDICGDFSVYEGVCIWLLVPQVPFMNIFILFGWLKKTATTQMTKKEKKMNQWKSMFQNLESKKNLTLKRRKTFRAKLVVLSTFWAVPGSPLLKNLEPYCIALHILSLASALPKYKTRRPSSALVASNVLIFYNNCCHITKSQHSSCQLN